MSNLNKILVVLIVVLVIALGAVVWWQVRGFEGPYWAVYLTTGDLYFGKLSYFPSLSLYDVFVFQRTNDERNPVGITPFAASFWGPEGRIYLNAQNVVWKAKISKGSPLVNYLKNPQVYGQQLPSQLPTSTQNQPKSQPGGQKQ